MASATQGGGGRARAIPLDKLGPTATLKFLESALNEVLTCG